MTHTQSNGIVDSSLYRNQFVLGPRYVPQFESWQKIKINDSLYLTAHPELGVHEVSKKGKSIILLGFMLDPVAPDATDPEIIGALIKNMVTYEDILQHTERFGGRWILIVNDGRDISLFNDATGLRQVYYTASYCTKGIWCASQPMIIAQLLNLEIDAEAAAFINSAELKNNKGRWWPGDGSPYKEIKHLLPNHRLDLRTGYSHRFWPNKKLDEIPLGVAIEKISPILQGLMQSAANRFDLTLLITAGRDSRLVLAACRGLAEKLAYVSVKALVGAGYDSKVPASLLSKLGLKHTIATRPSKPSRDFRTQYEKNAILLNESYAAVAEALFPYLMQRKVAVTGNDAEITRFFYKLPRLARNKLTPARICLLTGMGNHPFAVKAFEKWLSGMAHAYDFDLLDILYWEQRAGYWLANWLLEYDLVWKDCVVAFNSRRLLTTMLSVDKRYRGPPEYELYRKLIFSLWPELLCEPIGNDNMHARKRSYLWSTKTRIDSYRRSIKDNVRFLLCN